MNAEPHDLDWMDRAACAGKPTAWWFPDRHSPPYAYDLARAICAACPVINQCADYGRTVSPRIGMWGGVSPRQRRAPRKPVHREHGVYARYCYGCRCGACDPAPCRCLVCADENARRRAEQRARKLAS